MQSGKMNRACSFLLLRPLVQEAGTVFESIRTGDQSEQRGCSRAGGGGGGGGGGGEEEAKSERFGGKLKKKNRWLESRFSGDLLPLWDDELCEVALLRSERREKNITISKMWPL